jgi:putative transposase
MMRKNGDYEAFERVLTEAVERHPIRILSWCVMPTHWHFVVWPSEDRQVTDFFRWLTHTHAMRWRVSRNTVGYGHLYQGRFKSFPVQSDAHLLTVCRYVERNARTAGLVERAEAWRWGSLWARANGTPALRQLLVDGPVPFPDGWAERVNTPLTRKEVLKVGNSMRRDAPFGDETWTNRTADRLGLGHTVRPEGRPPNDKPDPRARYLALVCSAVLGFQR